MPTKQGLIAALLFTTGALAQGALAGEPPRSGPAIDLTVQAWHDRAICYSGYRAGQSPQTATYPTQAQILEDLRILQKSWRIIRMYGSDRHSEDTLEVIRREAIPLKMMLGIWLDGQPGNEAENEEQISTAIRLANAYKDVVVAVNVGNEALVSWSDHRMSEDRMLEHVKRVKSGVPCPVTVADDILYWREPTARLVGAVDFITLHSYPLWGGLDIDAGLSTTREHFETVRKAHPDKTIVLGEAGWATYTVGKQHAPQAGDERKQTRYFNELMTWAEEAGLTVFFFEAFDEPWKGEGTEGHWGLFTEGRKAKPVMQALFPELAPEGPTSPTYDEVP